MADIVLYVAATRHDAESGAAALDETASDLSVAAAVPSDRIRELAPAADCVVFAETPTTAEGSRLLDVVDACGPTPLVLYTGPEYAATTARATDGIAGYVRRDGDRSVTHLADEIRWVCHEPERGTERAPIPIGPSDSPADARDEQPNERVDDWLETVIEAVPDPAVRYVTPPGTDAVVRDVNAAFEDVFGDDRSSLQGTRLRDHRALEAVADDAVTSAERRDREEPLRIVEHCGTADGHRTLVATSVALERGDDSIGGIVTFRDVTDRKRREREIIAQRDRLETFERIVNRELRNHLNLAQGYLDVARATDDADHFGEVETAHDRIADAIDTLSSLSRRRDVIATVEPVALHDVARRAWARLDDDGDRVLHLEDDRLLEADKERVTDVLEHLFRSAESAGNAESDATTEDGTESATNENGTEPVTIRVGASQDGFFVADDGGSLEPEHRDRIRETDSDAIDRRDYGLEIVSRIAEAHGWSVSIRESADGGTRVEFVGASMTDDRVFHDELAGIESSLRNLDE